MHDPGLRVPSAGSEHWSAQASSCHRLSHSDATGSAIHSLAGRQARFLDAMSVAGKAREENGEAEIEPSFEGMVHDWERCLRQRYGGPYRFVLSTACRLIFARGQIDTSRVVDLRDVGFEASDRVGHSLRDGGSCDVHSGAAR